MKADWRIPADQEDPLLRSSRREMRVALIFWSVCAAWTLGYAKLNAYKLPPEGEEIALVLGVPAWAFWGVILPWALATLFTIWFALFSMTDHELIEPEPEPEKKNP